jgi:hypothetical protein
MCYVFNSLFLAVAVVLGRSANVRIEWKNQKGAGFNATSGA